MVIFIECFGSSTLITKPLRLLRWADHHRRLTALVAAAMVYTLYIVFVSRLFYFLISCCMILFFLNSPLPQADSPRNRYLISLFLICVDLSPSLHPLLFLEADRVKLVGNKVFLVYLLYMVEDWRFFFLKIKNHDQMS